MVGIALRIVCQIRSETCDILMVSFLGSSVVWCSGESGPELVSLQCGSPDGAFLIQFEICSKRPRSGKRVFIEYWCVRELVD